MAVRTVLCFGDSNTHGTCAMRDATDRRRHGKPDRWTSVMSDALGPDWEVIAEGHPGRTTVLDDPIEGAHRNGARMLLASLESHRPLDLVILMLGTNDLKARFNFAPHDIMLGLQRLALDVARSDCGPQGQPPQILIAAPVKVTETGIFKDTFAGAAVKSVSLAGLLGALAKRQALGFIDLNTVAEVDPIDGIHLGVAAHAAIGRAMAAAVSDHVNEQ